MNKPIATAIVHAPGIFDLNPGAGLAELPVGTHVLFAPVLDAVNSTAWQILKQLFTSAEMEYMINSTKETKAAWLAAEEALDQFLASATASEGRIAELTAKIADLEALVAKRDKFAFIMGQTLHNVMVGNQAAWIEWQHGSGAEEAMTWIHNGLVGPGLIPAGREAQQWFDENVDDRYEIPEAKSVAALAGSATPSPEPVEANPFSPPDRWTLLLTGDNNGCVGKFGESFKGSPTHYDRVDVQRIQPSPAVQKDSERLQFLLDEGAIVDSANSKSGMRYWLVWTACGSLQSDDYASPREAIDAAIASMAATQAKGNGL